MHMTVAKLRGRDKRIMAAQYKKSSKNHCVRNAFRIVAGKQTIRRRIVAAMQ
jgi:hypothetical protein